MKTMSYNDQRHKQSITDTPFNKKCFDNVMDSIRDGVVCIDADGYFIYANNAILERFGMTRDQFYQCRCFDLVVPERREHAKEAFYKVLNGETIPPYEVRHESSNGQVRILEAYGKPVYEGEKVSYIVAVARDITALKQAEEAYGSSEARYRAVVEDQEEMICRFLPDSTLTFVNGAFCRSFGQSSDGLLGRKFLTFIQKKEDAEAVMKRITALSVEMPLEMHEHRSISASGEESWQQWAIRALFNDKGCLTEIQAVGRDITLLKQTEEKLRRSDEHFRNLLENLPIGIFTYEGSKFRYVNTVGERITGYTREELYEKDVWDIIHPDFKNNVRQYVQVRQLGEHVPEYQEAKIITKSGEERWVERRAITADLTEQPSVLVSVSDITARKRAEERLRKSEEKHRIIMESASDAMLFADEHGNLIECNRAAEKLWGYSREELLQLHFTQLHPAMDQERTTSAFKAITTNGKGGLIKGAILRRDGSIVPVDINATAIEYHGKTVFQAAFRDISESLLSKIT